MNKIKTQMALVIVAAMLYASLIVRAADRPLTPKANRERASLALRSEQVKWEAGKTTLFSVCQASKDMRTVELQASTNAAQRIATHKRHIAVIRDLKARTDEGIRKGMLSPLDGKLVDQELKEAEARLLRAENSK